MRSYIEPLWREGGPRGRAVYAVAGLDRTNPLVHHLLAGAWELIRVWERCELPARATPFTPELIVARYGLAVRVGCCGIAVLCS